MPDKIGHRLPGGEKAVSWQEAPSDGKGKSDKSPGKMLLAKIKKNPLDCDHEITGDLRTVAKSSLSTILTSYAGSDITAWCELAPLTLSFGYKTLMYK